MTKRGALLLILPVSLIILITLCLAFILPDKAYSDTEYRSLAQRPDFSSWESVPSLFEDYFTDQFPARGQLVRAYTELQLLQNKTYVRDLYVSEDGWLIPRDYLLSHWDMEQAARCVNELAAASPDKALYFLCVPQKSYLFGYKLPYEGMTHHENLPVFTAALDSGVRLVNAADAMDAMPPAVKETLFYRTDFHWNARGAFEAYKLLLDEMIHTGDLPGHAAARPEDYPETVTGQRYLGDLNRRMSYRFDAEETIQAAYKDALPVVFSLWQDGGWQEVPANSIYNTGADAPETTYNDAYTDNLGRYKMTSPLSATGQKLLVIKDSMQNPTSSLFPAVFRETEVIDPRFLTDITVKEIAAASDADLVVIFYNSSNITGDMYNFG